MQFEVADATKRTFPEGSFDVIYSRDTILHIDDKLALFKRFHVSSFSMIFTVALSLTSHFIDISSRICCGVKVNKNLL